MLRVRSGPGKQYRTIGYTEYGKPFLYPCGDWPWLYNYGRNGPKGWVNGRYTSTG